jgi:cyclic pyranopterin phosphate synthase
MDSGTDFLTHLDGEGRPRMVDVTGKGETARKATASGVLRFSGRVPDLFSGGNPKGDPTAAAVIAGIQAAKRTPDLIPLCHPLSAGHVDVRVERSGERELRVTCTVSGTARTGFEMEALTGAAVALLTLYDMTKAADRSMVIDGVRLTAKTGGRSGDRTEES